MRTTADLWIQPKQASKFLHLISESFLFPHLTGTHFSAVYWKIPDPVPCVTHRFSETCQSNFSTKMQKMCKISTTVRTPALDPRRFPECMFCHKRSLITDIICQPSILKWDLMEGTDAKMKQWWNNNEMLTDILFLLMLPEILRCINCSHVSSGKVAQLHLICDVVSLHSAALLKIFSHLINIIFMSVLLAF